MYMDDIKLFPKKQKELETFFYMQWEYTART